MLRAVRVQLGKQGVQATIGKPVCVHFQQAEGSVCDADRSTNAFRRPLDGIETEAAQPAAGVNRPGSDHEDAELPGQERQPGAHDEPGALRDGAGPSFW